MNFIEKNTKKVALILGLTTAVSAVTTVYAAQNSDGWHGSGEQRIFKEDGKTKVNAWVYQPDGTYYVNAEGHPANSEWLTIKNSLYYFDKDGKKVTGKQVIDGHEYTFQKSGVLLTGWNEAKDTYYNKFGNPTTGFLTVAETLYNFDENGKVVTGWFTVNNKKVYFDADGSMATKETLIDGKKHNFNSDGTITKGWVSAGGEKFYYNNYGYMTTGWETIDGNKYYFNKQGQAATNTEYAGYAFDPNGVATEIKKEEETAKQVAGTTSKSTSSSVRANSGISASALAQLGRYQDCTALVSNALRANGINFHGWPADYMSLGSITNSPQSGDLIYYANGGLGAAHIAVYIGNGQAVHGGWVGNNTVQGSAYVGSGPVFIRVNK